MQFPTKKTDIIHLKSEILKTEKLNQKNEIQWPKIDKKRLKTEK